MRGVECRSPSQAAAPFSLEISITPPRHPQENDRACDQNHQNTHECLQSRRDNRARGGYTMEHALKNLKALEATPIRGTHVGAELLMCAFNGPRASYGKQQHSTTAVSPNAQQASNTWNNPYNGQANQRV